MSDPNPFDEFAQPGGPQISNAVTTAKAPDNWSRPRHGSHAPGQPVPAPSVTTASGPFDEFYTPASPAPAIQAQAAPASWLQRANAFPAGFNRGAAALLGLPMDTAANVTDLLKSGVESGYLATGHLPPTWLDPSRDRSNLPLSGDWIRTHLGSAAAIPRPDDAASRYLATAGSVVPSAMLTGGASAATVPAAIANTARTTAAAIPSVFAGQAVSESQPFGTNTGANNAAAIAAQLATGQVAPMAAATTRGLIRGSNPADMNANVNAFRALGAEPTLGQASGSRLPQALESGLSKMPGSAGRMQAKAQAQAADIGAGVGRIVSGLSPSGASVERAGRAIEEGVTGEGGFRDQFRGTAQQLYGNVDRYIPPDSPTSVSNTMTMLNDLSRPSPGAPATSALLSNPRIAAIREALSADTGANANTAAQAGMPATGTLPWEALSRIRTQIGGMLSGNELISDIPKAQLKQLYGAISSDMENAAQTAGPNAARAFSRANTFYKAGLDRLDTLQDVVNRDGPEGIFNAALSGTKYGASRVRAIMQSLTQPAPGGNRTMQDTEAQRTVAATVLRRMGTAAPGAQDATGAVFSPQTFLTNWQKLSPEAKSALFDRFPNGLRERIDNIADVASNLREGSKVFANPSGTAGASHLVGDLTKVLGAAGVAWHEVGGWHAPAAVLGSAGAANVLARASTNPRVVDWAARSTNFFGPGQQAALLAAPGTLASDESLRQTITRALQQAQQAQGSRQ